MIDRWVEESCKKGKTGRERHLYFGPICTKTCFTENGQILYCFIFAFARSRRDQNCTFLKAFSRRRRYKMPPCPALCSKQKLPKAFFFFFFGNNDVIGPLAISAGRETHATSRNNNTYGWQRICVTAVKDDQPVAAAAAQCFSPHQQEANNSGPKKKKKAIWCSCSWSNCGLCAK